MSDASRPTPPTDPMHRPEMQGALEKTVASGGGPLGHPPGLFLLFVVEMWERFSYYGMRALLVLYLMSVLAVHQLAPGVYRNVMDFSEVRGPQDAQTLITQSREFQIIVGDATDATASPEVTAPAAPADASIRITRLLGRADPSDPKKTIWDEPEEVPSSLITIAGPEGGNPDRTTRGFSNTEVRYRLSNPTDATITMQIGVRREAPGAPTFLTINKSPSDQKIEIPPDSGRAADEPPVDIIVRANTHDSGRNWTEAGAYRLYGLYTGLAYLLPVLGGLIADRILGTHRSMLLGGIVIAAGHIVLGLSGLGDLAHNELGLSVFVGGLALIVLGTGYFKPTVSVMVGQLYPAGDPRRDGGFSIFYMGINLGAFLAALGCGYLGEKVGWHWGFGAAAVGMVLGLVTYMALKSRYLAGVGDPPPGARNVLIPLGLTTVVISAVVALVFHRGGFNMMSNSFVRVIDSMIGAFGMAPGDASRAIIAFAMLMVPFAALTIVMTAIQTRGDKGPVFCIFVFILFNAFFWLAFEQAGSTLNVFANENTDRMIGTWEMPASFFQSFNAGYIILMAPIFAWLWVWLGKRKLNPNQPMKISLGLILLGLGYIVMVLGAEQASTGVKVGMWVLTVTYLLHTMGELCLSPTGLSFVTKAAPVRFVSFLMGMWFLSSFVANLGAGLVATMVTKIEKGEIQLPWSDWFAQGSRAPFFMLFVVSSLGAGVLILILTPVLTKLLKGRG